jgi:hypothetical protein
MLSRCKDAVDYYHEHEGCKVLKKELEEALEKYNGKKLLEIPSHEGKITKSDLEEKWRQKAEQWKQVCIKVGHALNTENAEQFEDPEITKTMLLRQIKWNRQYYLEAWQREEKTKEKTDSPA